MSLLPADTRIGHVSLAVSNLARSVAFYTETLGFRVHETRDGTAWLGAPEGRPILELVQDAAALPRARRTSGLYHVAVLVPDRAALGRSIRRLAEQGWPLSGAADHLVSEAIYLNDPDHLGLEIYRDRPRESWTIRDGEVAMATEPLDLEAVAREPGAEAAWSGLAPATAIGHVHLHVPDLAAAEALYCGEVGFSPTLRGYPGALFVAAGGYHHHVGLNTWAGAGAPPPGNAVGLRRFCVEASGLADREITDDRTGVTIRLAGAA